MGGGGRGGCPESQKAWLPACWVVDSGGVCGGQGGQEEVGGLGESSVESPQTRIAGGPQNITFLNIIGYNWLRTIVKEFNLEKIDEYPLNIPP